jgi:hypothetical protein
MTEQRRKLTVEEQKIYQDGRMARIENAQFDVDKPELWQEGWRDQNADILEFEKQRNLKRD